MIIGGIKKNQVYQHYKGSFYIVRSLSKSTDNPSQVFVNYEKIYVTIDSDADEEIWSRPIEEWFNNVPTTSDGIKTRFTLQ